MFNNIGGKIKALATLVCLIGMAASVIGAIALWATNSRYNNTIWTGFVVLIAGCVGSWVGSFFAYGFGELIEETKRSREVSEQLLLHLRGKTAGQERGAQPSVEPAGQSAKNPPAGTNGSQLRSDPTAPRSVIAMEKWQCRCGTRNASNQIFCASCGEMNPGRQIRKPAAAKGAESVKTAAGASQLMTVNMWSCRCGRKNSPSDKTCTFCGQER